MNFYKLREPDSRHVRRYDVAIDFLPHMLRLDGTGLLRILPEERLPLDTRVVALGIRSSLFDDDSVLEVYLEHPFFDEVPAGESPRPRSIAIHTRFLSDDELAQIYGDSPLKDEILAELAMERRQAWNAPEAAA